MGENPVEPPTEEEEGTCAVRGPDPAASMGLK